MNSCPGQVGILERYLQSKNRDVDEEYKHINTVVGGGGMNREIGIDIYILLILCIK